MLPRKARGHVSHEATYDQDDIPRDEAVANMTTTIDMLSVQMAKLLAKHHPTLEREDKSNENFANPFFEHWHRTESTNNRIWESRLRIDISKFQGSGRPEELLD